MQPPTNVKFPKVVGTPSYRCFHRHKWETCLAEDGTVVANAKKNLS